MPVLKPIRGIRLNKSHPLARGLVGYWLFNEGSGNKVFDLSGNGNTGVITGATWQSGPNGSVLRFTDDIVDCGTNPTINNLSEFTIYQHVMTTALPGEAEYYYTICQRDDDEIRMALFLHSDFAGVWAFSIYADGDNGIIESAAAPSINTWYDIAITYNDAGDRTPKLYINGIDVGVNAVATTGNLVSAPTVPITLGNRAISLNRDWHGDIGLTYIYNRALSASEIALLYREPFCMFDRAWRPGLIGGQIVELAGTIAGTSGLLDAVLSSICGLTGTSTALSSVKGSLGIMGESPPETERSWLREALFNGMTASAFKLGTTLSLGWFWVRVAGCSVLYRGSSMGALIDFANILAVSNLDASEISPPNYISHDGGGPGGSTYFYVVRRFNNNGYQEHTLAAAVKVSISFSGELAEPQPNNISSSKVEQVASNKIRLAWFYCPLEQKSQPVSFNVYYDDRTGQIDYQNPLATIGYKGRKFYSFQSSALEAGKYLFAIRAEDAGGIENISLARLKIQLDTLNPDAIDILRVEAV